LASETVFLDLNPLALRLMTYPQRLVSLSSLLLPATIGCDRCLSVTAAIPFLLRKGLDSPPTKDAAQVVYGI
jgi:hypothetical protein